MQNENDDSLAVLGVGLFVLAVATAPVWLPVLTGIKPKNCECSAKIESSSITPGCRCNYLIKSETGLNGLKSVERRKKGAPQFFLGLDSK